MCFKCQDKSPRGQFFYIRTFGLILTEEQFADCENGKDNRSHTIGGEKGEIDPGKIIGFDEKMLVGQENEKSNRAQPEYPAAPYQDTE